MKYPVRVAVIAALAVCSLALSAGSAVSSTSAPSDSLHSTTISLVTQRAEQAILSGTYTPSDVAAVKAGDPGMVSHLPGAATHGSKSYAVAVTAKDRVALVAAGADPAAVATSSFCRSFDGWVTQTDVTGRAILYVWHHWIGWCGVYGSVISYLTNEYYYVTNRDWTWLDNGVDKYEGAVGHYSLDSQWFGHMTFFKYTFSHYPRVGITSYANGTASFIFDKG